MRFRVYTNVTYADLLRSRDIYSVLAMTGLLRVVRMDWGFELSIPNMGVYGVFADEILSGLNRRVVVALDGFCDPIVNGDAKGISDGLSFLLSVVMVSDVVDYDSFRWTIVAGMLMRLCGRYSMSEKRGDGYHDILLKANRPCDPHIIMEFKKADSDAGDDAMDALSSVALQQIRDREYFHGLEGSVLIYGIAVRGKDVTVSSDAMSI